MTTPKDLAKRLRKRQMQQTQRYPGDRTTRVVVVDDPLCQLAADLIERQAAEIAALRVPLTVEQLRDLVKECGLDWHRGFMPLFDGDETNRYELLVRAIEACHGITAPKEQT